MLAALRGPQAWQQGKFCGSSFLCFPEKGRERLGTLTWHDVVKDSSQDVEDDDA